MLPADEIRKAVRSEYIVEWDGDHFEPFIEISGKKVYYESLMETIAFYGVFLTMDTVKAGYGPEIHDEIDRIMGLGIKEKQS